VVVTVAEAYIHCAKTLRRAVLWSPTSWLDPAHLPSAACVVKDHAALEGDVASIERAREHALDISDKKSDRTHGQRRHGRAPCKSSTLVPRRRCPLDFGPSLGPHNRRGLCRRKYAPGRMWDAGDGPSRFVYADLHADNECAD
jgi:hypothetical protein